MSLRSMPVFGSLYPEPPYIYEGTRLLMVLYQVEREQVENILPEEFKISRRVMAMAFIAEYPKSTIGPYYEAATFFEVTYKGEKGKKTGLYCNSMFVDSDIAMAAGREIWGFPKKLANMILNKEDNEVIGILNRKNIDLMRIDLKIKEEVSELPIPEVPLITIRQFFEPGGGTYALKQVQGTIMELVPEKVYWGETSLQFNKSSEDPIYFLEPISVIGGYYITLKKGVLPYGEIY